MVDQFLMWFECIGTPLWTAGCAIWYREMKRRSQQRDKQWESDVDYARDADEQHAQSLHADLRGMFGNYPPYDLETGKLVDIDAISEMLAQDDELHLDGDCKICNRRLKRWLDAELEYLKQVDIWLEQESEFEAQAEALRQHRARQDRRRHGPQCRCGYCERNRNTGITEIATDEYGNLPFPPRPGAIWVMPPPDEYSRAQEADAAILAQAAGVPAIAVGQRETVKQSGCPNCARVCAVGVGWVRAYCTGNCV